MTVPPGVTLPDRARLVAMVAVGAGLPGLIAVGTGSLGVPFVDDRSYMTSALTLFRNGRIDLGGFPVMALFGQLYLTQPLLWISGGAPWSFATYTLVCSALAIASAFLMAKDLGLQRLAVIPAALLLLAPGYLRTASTYMTDVPATGFELLSLWLGVRAMRGRTSLPTLLAGVIAGVIAVSIRQFALAAPVAILLAAVVREPRRLAVLALAASGAAGVVLMLWIAQHLPGALPLHLGLLPNPGNAKQLLGAVATMGLMLAPLLAIVAWRVPFARAAALIALASIVAGVVPEHVLLIHMWFPEGINGRIISVEPRARLFDPLAWDIIQWLAVMGAYLIAAGSLTFIWHSRLRLRRLWGAALVGSVGTPLGAVLMFVVSTSLGLAVYGLAGPLLMDRYLWPLIPPASVLTLVTLRRTGVPDVARTAAWVVFAITAVSALALTANSAAFDVAMARLGDLASTNAPSGSVDVGGGWLRIFTGPEELSIEAGRSGRPTNPPCAVVVTSPISAPGYAMTASEPEAYQLLWLLGPAQPLYLYERTDGRCGPLTE